MKQSTSTLERPTFCSLLATTAFMTFLLNEHLKTNASFLFGTRQVFLAKFEQTLLQCEEPRQRCTLSYLE